MSISGIIEIKSNGFFLLVIDKIMMTKINIDQNGKPTFMTMEISGVARKASKRDCI